MGRASLAPVQARVGEAQLDGIIDSIHLLEAQHVADEDMQAAVRGEAMIATGVGAVVLPQCTGAVTM